MGIIRAFIVVITSLVITNYLYTIFEKYKEKPILRMIKPYINSKNDIMLIIIIMILIII